MQQRHSSLRASRSRSWSRTSRTSPGMRPPRRQSGSSRPDLGPVRDGCDRPKYVKPGIAGQQNVRSFIVDDPGARLEAGSASDTLGALRGLLDEEHQDYIRVELPAANVVAFADFTTGTYVYADRNTSDFVDLDPPSAPPPPWQPGVDALIQLAG